MILRYLQKHPKGATFHDLVAALEQAQLKHTSAITARRALDFLRDYQDAPIFTDESSNTWELDDASFSMPMIDPSQADLTSVIFAAATLGPLAPPQTRERIERLVEMMDATVRGRGEGPETGRTSLTASLTTGMPVDADTVSLLASACSASGVVEITYYSPWSDERKRYVVEPWQLRIHDGTMYLRGYSRAAKAARTFRVVQIEGLRRLVDEPAIGARPPGHAMWGGDDGVGVDDDRPDTAVIRIGGAYARWVELECWDASQHDAWSPDGSVLERRVEYRSCREFARRLLSLGDGLLSVAPAALEQEVTAHLERLHARLLPTEL